MPNINEKKMLCKKISKNAKNEGKKKSNLVTLPSWIGRHRQQKLHTWTAWLEKTREMIHFQQHQKKKTCENTGEIFHESLPKITKTLMYPHFSCIYRRWNLDIYFLKYFFGEKYNRFQN